MSGDGRAPEPDGTIAVISLGGRFPGADGVEAFWDNLVRCEDSISRFSAGELLASGRDDAWVRHPRFVGAEGVLGDIELFDAEFFGYPPREAAIMDPQHRLCLETAWHVFDTAGYDPAATGAATGVFLSASLSSYLIRNVLPGGAAQRLLGGFPLLIHNDKDFLATTVSHKLGLTGPSYAVGSACSSSLVAVHLACQSLLAHECDMALAGGISLQVPQGQGYVYAEDGIYAPDGRCAPFDAGAGGTVGGSGVGLVLLKRFADAVRDGDRVHALILGSAVNNDGADKVGYTAPSVTGQSAAVAEALAVARIPADTVGALEAHGTGTRLGDPVEVEALTRAFRAQTDRSGYCALGSVKANVGHLDAAAGVTGLIKAVLAVREGVIPGTPHFRSPNPAIDFPRTPFYVNADTIPWPETAHPRRAGVSSFGIGGTNAHVVLEQPPPLASRAPEAAAAMPLVVSARSRGALTTALSDLAAWTSRQPAPRLTDLSATLAGRRAFPHRAAVVCHSLPEAARLLTDAPAEAAHPGRATVFLFPGQGAALPGSGLYDGVPRFRAHFDACAAAFDALGADVSAAPRPQDTGAAQPALFAVEYALARTLTDWGLRPAAMLGHSLGEYVAATLAGVLSLPDAATLVQARAAAQHRLPPGRMLAVPLTADALRPLLDGELEITALNAPDRCVVGGPPEPVEALAALLAGRGVHTTVLATDHAFHSAAVEPLLDDFRAVLERVELRPPRLRYVSSLTGDWADARVASPAYWLEHMRRPVRFADALRRCLDLGPVALLETGPPAGLTALARRASGFDDRHRTVRCLTAGDEATSLTRAVAELWRAGCDVDWTEFHRPHRPRRTTVPGYPFQRARHWVEATQDGTPAATGRAAAPHRPAVPADRTSAGRAPATAATRPAQSAPALPHTDTGTTAAPPRAGTAPDGIPAGTTGALAPTPPAGLAAPGAEPPALADLAAALRAELRTGAAGPRGIDDRPGLRTGLNRLCAALARDHLATGPGPGGVLPEFRRFADFLRTMAGEAPAEAADAVAAEVVGAHPDFAGLVELLTHCARAYPRALSTPGAALDVLYPAGDGELLRRTLGERTADHRATGRLTELTGSLLDRLAAERDGPLRVLEVGAGEGNLTRALVGRAPGRLEYHATDISRLFVTRLAEEAARRGLDFVRTRVLDIARDPGGQGFAGEHFDLVCGLDVVHATADLRTTLGHLRSLLAPDGTLALIETTAQDPWLTMIWGLTSGWWSSTDRRVHGPLLDADGWQALLDGQDFRATDVIVPATGPRDAALVLARRAGEPATRDVGTWCYAPGWRHAAPAPAAEVAGECLLFGDGEAAKAVAGRLEALGVAVTTVGGAEPPTPREYRELVGDHTRLAVHLWPLHDARRRGRAASAGTVRAAQNAGLHSLLHLARAFGAREERRPVRLVAVTTGAQEVLGDDLAHPEHATVAAAAKVIPREYPWIACTAMDVPPDIDADHLAGLVVAELRTARESTVTAYRGRRRFTPCHTRQPLPPVGEFAGVRPHGVYVVCGGLGGIGLHLAEYLGRTPATVVLTHRRPFPAPGEWDDLPGGHPEAAVVRRLRRITAAGGTVLVRRADITDHRAMNALVAEVERDHGPVRGVVHAAGTPDTAGMIQRRDRAATDAAVAAKLTGALVLDEVFAGREPDFLVLCSSIGTVLHKLKFGEVGYVAGNEFLNAFAAHRAARRPGRTLSIAWTDWRESGMWATAQRRLTERYGTGADLPVRPGGDLLGALTPREGVELFARLLASGTGPGVVISTQDLDELLARHEAYTTDDHLAALRELRISGSDRDRAHLPTPYRAPTTPTERRIADWFRDLLGFDEVGVADDFFALGGDSLLALRLLAQLRDAHGVEIPLARMFAEPTVAALAAAVDRPGGPDGPTGQEEVLL
ncbi:SDR family NAD(P)-dependent oxidoreductase [Streptomyces sp. NPDC046261]|uniref:type I polyketide synthase n=1 Tax=Streptomyces sp. NPDC046261 TaxID=3157200 RepID=UPI0033CE92A1